MESSPAKSVAALFPGAGEMAERLRAFDWAASALGPISAWPSSFTSTLGIVVSARFPMAIYWAKEGWLFYNDAWSPILGQKHPWALGKSAREVWPEIWDAIEPDFRTVLERGEATWRSDQLLPMQRFGYTEECYFDYTFNPIRGAAGAVEGILNVVQETTERVLAERRTRFLRELSTATATAKSESEACGFAIRAFQSDPQDFPFAQLHLVEPSSQRVTRVAHTGIGVRPEAPDTGVDHDEWINWPFAETLRTGEMIQVDDFERRFEITTRGPWPEPIKSAVVLPIVGAGNEGFSAILLAGLNPRRPLDDSYRRLLELTASHLATAIATASSYASERRRAETLAELDRAKTTFFSNISHELRTPLTLMLGPIEDELREAKNPRLEMAYRNSLRLLKLVNTLLEFSRIEAGRLEISYQPIDLARFTNELVSVFRSAIEKAGLRLNVACAPLSQPAYVDPDLWEKIVLNLVSNALKFTFEGEVEVLLRERSSPPAAILSVRDTGTGIPAAELRQVFERFHRVKNAKSRSHEGSGIGLALVDELTRLHGGSVEVESTEGVGTTFFVTIPMGVDHLSKDKIQRETVSAPSFSTPTAFVDEALSWLPAAKSTRVAEPVPISPTSPESEANRDTTAPKMGLPRILLADDNRDMREYLERLLSEEGYLVVSASDGQTALEAALSEPPSLVLSDIMMPRLDGFGLVRELRRDARTRTVPIILLSARAGEESTVAGVESGADDYLVKPFSTRELVARVRTQLELSHLRNHSDALLEGERRRLYDAMMHAPAQIVILRGPQHIIELSNFAHQRANGRSTTVGFVGKPVREAQPEISGQGYFEILDRVYTTGEPFGGKEAKVAVKSATGGTQDIYVNFVYLPTRAVDGTVNGIFVHAVDVTEQVLARVEMEQLAKRLTQANALLSDRAALLDGLVEQRTSKLRESIAELESFSYSIAHDMRAPLRSLQGYADILIADYAAALEPDAQHFLARISTAATRMDKLIQDVLSYSKIARGELLLERISLEKLLREIIETYPTFAQEKAQIELVGPIENVIGNEAMLTQVFSNLMGNAVKFVKPGIKPAIQIKTEAVGAKVIISVSDNGIGIPEKQHTQVFEMFHQLDNASGGTGIGLAIVKKAVDRMSGKIWVVSTVGEGSTFYIELARPNLN